jgi:4-methyl-5(b-hydroxyethyl)-thiazole monophosphate biosynthesis
MEIAMTKRVLLLLADGFEPLEAAGFTDVFGWAAIDGDEPVELVSAGFKSPLKATFGFSVIPQALVQDLDLSRFDALAVPGGFEGAGFYDEALSEPFLEVIRHFEGRKSPVASVCVASLALGAAGVFRGRRATTYHQVGGKRKAQLEEHGALFVDRPIVEDSGLISSTGPGTSVEVALKLLAMLTSEKNAGHIRSLMRVPVPGLDWQMAPQVDAA